MAPAEVARPDVLPAPTAAARAATTVPDFAAPADDTGGGWVEPANSDAGAAATKPGFHASADDEAGRVERTDGR